MHCKKVSADLALPVLLHLQLELLHLLRRQPLQRQLRRRLVRQLPCQDHLHICHGFIQAPENTLLTVQISMLQAGSSVPAHLSWRAPF